MEEEVTRLRDVVVLAVRTFRYCVMWLKTNQNDKRKLIAYELDSYSKIEIDIDKITDKIREKKIVSRITQGLDSIERIAGRWQAYFHFIFRKCFESLLPHKSELKFENIKRLKSWCRF